MKRKILRTFTLPNDFGEWKPATIDDAVMVGQDLSLFGTAFATEDGHRIDPLTVTINNDGTAETVEP